jgi:hypothetical protein
MRYNSTHVITLKKGKNEIPEGGETESIERKEWGKNAYFHYLILLFMVLFNNDVNMLDFTDD